MEGVGCGWVASDASVVAVGMEVERASCVVSELLVGVENSGVTVGNTGLGRQETSRILIAEVITPSVFIQIKLAQLRAAPQAVYLKK